MKKDNVGETKVLVYSEVDYRKITNEFDLAGRNYYTFQFRTSKGLEVAIKSIDPPDGPTEISEMLSEKGAKISPYERRL